MRLRISRFIRRIREVWAELDYAQRRLLELRTGLSLGAREDFGPPRGRAHPRALKKRSLPGWPPPGYGVSCPAQTG